VSHLIREELAGWLRAKNLLIYTADLLILFIYNSKPEPPKIAFDVPTHQRHCEYQSFEYVHLYGLAHAAHPVNPFPPHCAHRAAVHPPGAAVVLVVGTVEVLLLVVVVGAAVELDEVVPGCWPVIPNQARSIAPITGTLCPTDGL